MSDFEEYSAEKYEMDKVALRLWEEGITIYEAQRGRPYKKPSDFTPPKEYGQLIKVRKIVTKPAFRYEFYIEEDDKPGETVKLPQDYCPDRFEATCYEHAFRLFYDYIKKRIKKPNKVKIVNVKETFIGERKFFDYIPISKENYTDGRRKNDKIIADEAEVKNRIQNVRLIKEIEKIARRYARNDEFIREDLIQEAIIRICQTPDKDIFSLKKEAEKAIESYYRKLYRKRIP